MNTIEKAIAVDRIKQKLTVLKGMQLSQEELASFAQLSNEIKKSIFNEYEEKISKSLNTASLYLSEEDFDDLEKSMNHKYFKREGSPGDYKYYYTEQQYKEAQSHYQKPEVKAHYAKIQEMLDSRKKAQEEKDARIEEEAKKPKEKPVKEKKASTLISRAKYERILRNAISDARGDGNEEHTYDMATSLIYDPEIKERLQKDHPQEGTKALIKRLQYDLEAQL